MRYKTIILLYNIIRDSGGCVISLSLEVVFQSWESISPTGFFFISSCDGPHCHTLFHPSLPLHSRPHPPFSSRVMIMVPGPKEFQAVQL